MCGVVAYTGGREAAPILLEALERLAYRGYDSAGVAVCAPDGRIRLEKAGGRLAVLRERTGNGAALAGCTGIGHTRWATHGAPDTRNAHPHRSFGGRVALVHNGVIENHAELRAMLEGEGCRFVSETDTEVAATLLDFLCRDDPLEALQRAAEILKGSYAFALLFVPHPGRIYALRKGSPLILGMGEGEQFIASDIPALLPHTRRILRLGEGEMAVLDAQGAALFGCDGRRVYREAEHVRFSAQAAEKGGYAHFMHKEIMESPAAVRRTLEGRVGAEDAAAFGVMGEAEAQSLGRIHIVACGSAYHAGMLGKSFLERHARIPVSLSLASEFRHEEALPMPHTLTLAISQSGETIDTLYALRAAKARGSRTLALVNAEGSSIACEADEVLYTRAGPEIAVATTKAYSAQLALLALLSLHLGRLRGALDGAACREGFAALAALPAQMEALLARTEDIEALARRFCESRSCFFTGRGPDYALAMEGALKLKEVSYIHAEACAAGEFKHGPIALLEPGTPVLALCTHGPALAKMRANLREYRARGAAVAAICEAGAAVQKGTEADILLEIPPAHPLARPALAILPLQLLAYHAALYKGCDVDKPRNLAKSVTVE